MDFAAVIKLLINHLKAESFNQLVEGKVKKIPSVWRIQCTFAGLKMEVPTCQGL